jgi:hypothetical protein
LQHQPKRAAIEQGVMKSPNQLKARSTALEQRKPQQRHVGHHKAPRAVRSQELLKPLLLFRRRKASPVRHLKWQRDITPDFLEQRFEPLLAEAGAQDRVAADYFFPRVSQLGDVQLLVQAANQLLNVHS